MPTLNLNLTKIATDELKKAFDAYPIEVTIGTLAALLRTDSATAHAWLVAKVAAFRGVSESEIEWELRGR